MQLLKFAFFGLLSGAEVASAVALPNVDARAVNDGPVLPPDSDPFYQPPIGFENAAPGTVLRNRSIVSNFFNLPNPVSAWQLQYRTTAIDGTPIAAVTTVFKPAHALLDRFVSFATAYDASASKCNPSYYYRLGSGANASEHGITQAESLIIEGYLLQGYIVASPDYEGPDTAFSPGRLEGHCVLDNMRAVLNFAPAVGFSVLKPAIVGHGYSGGAIATGWAAALQPSYAPELPVKGWAHGGTPANLTGTLLKIDNGSWSGYVTAAVAGLAAPSAFGKQFQPVLDQILTEKGQTALQYARTHCQSDDLSQYTNFSLFNYDFQTIGPKVLYEPTIANVLSQCVLGAESNETPTKPVFVYHSRTDQIIPYENISSTVDTWCKRGASVQFTSFATGDHVSTAIAGIPNVYTFVAKAFDGLTSPGCSRDDVPFTAFDALNFGAALASKLAPILPQMSQFLHF